MSPFLPLHFPNTYDANEGTGEDPAEFPPSHWIVTDHFFDSIVESVDSKRPRNGDALEEYEEEQTKTAHGVGVQDLEDVHATLQMNAAHKKRSLVKSRK